MRDKTWGRASRGGILLAFLLIAVAGIAIYAPNLSPSPIMDDAGVYLEHDEVRQGSGWWVAPYYSNAFRPIWRPLATLSFRLNWLAQPGDRTPVVATNLGLLILAAGLAVLLFRRLGAGLIASGAAGLLFLIHPVTSESVLRLAGRADLLCEVFLLGAMLWHVSWSRSSGGAMLRGVVWGTFYALALLAKEIALVLPLLAAAFEAIDAASRDHGGDPQARLARRRRWLMLLVITVIVSAWWGSLRAGVIRGWPVELKKKRTIDYVAAMTDRERQSLSTALPAVYGEMIVRGGPILPSYAHIIAWPEEAPPVALGDPRTFGVGLPSGTRQAAGVAILVLAVLAFTFLHRRAPRVALGGAWLAITLIAVLPLFGSNGQVASGRSAVLPLLGILLALTGLARGRRGAVAAAVVGLVLAGFYTTKTLEVARAWSSRDSMTTYLAEKAPRSPEVPYYRGMLAMRGGDVERAAAKMEECIALFPRHPQALLNLGVLRMQQGRSGLAGRILSDAAFVAAQVAPHTAVHSQAHLARGKYYGMQNMDDAATEEFLRAIAADSTNVQALALAGAMELTKGSTLADGVRHIHRALELDHAGLLGPLGDHIRERVVHAESLLARRGLGEEIEPESMSTPELFE